MVAACVGAVALAGCSVLPADSAARTYGEAAALPSATLADVRRSASAVDTANVVAYVVGYHVCPPEAACPRPEGITLAAARTPRPGEAVFVPVAEPRQFVYGRRYVFSLRTAPQPGGGGRRDVWLVGYSPAS